MIPIAKPFISNEEIRAVTEVVESGWLVQGDKVKRFEDGIAKHESVSYACSVTSCTAALHISMLAEKMREGMDVFVPSFTFVATANAVVSTGATPILSDINLDTFNMDGDRIEQRIEAEYISKNGKLFNKVNGNELWGIVPVHQFGLCANMDKINAIRDKYGIKVIEDAACALGSMSKSIHIGNFGNTACVSFHPRKCITTGEGGMVLTNDKDIYDEVLMLRNHGSKVMSDERHKKNGGLLPDYPKHGFNYRMTDLQGALGIVQMTKLDEIIKERRKIASIYDDILHKQTRIRTPFSPKESFHTYQSYVCRIISGMDDEKIELARNRIIQKFEQEGISVRQGTHAVHKLNFYKSVYGYNDSDLHNADLADRSTIALPIYVGLTEKDQESICEKFIRFINEEFV